MRMKLSVIVPIYRVEKYLRKCVDSLLHQDLISDEYEIILVDDGSPDACGRIADEYASTYPNIRAIHQKNGGLSVARNTGLVAAEGEYVQFVDSDDYLLPDVIPGLLHRMEEENLDVLRFNYQNVNESGEAYEPYKDIKPFVDYTDGICDGKVFLNERLGYACYAVQFIIRKEILTANNIIFKPGIRFEDTEWTPRMLLCASRVTSTDKMVYCYLLRSGSITNSCFIEGKRKIVEDKLHLIESLKKQKKESGNMLWFDGMISLTAISTLVMVSTDFYKERRSYLREFRRLGVLPLSLYHISERSARKVRIANVSPALFCFIHHLKNNR